VPIPGAQQHKRPRRRYEEIERMYKCGHNGCEKAYGTLNHLNAHVTMQGHGSKRTPEGKLDHMQLFAILLLLLSLFFKVIAYPLAWSSMTSSIAKFSFVTQHWRSFFRAVPLNFRKHFFHLSETKLHLFSILSNSFAEFSFFFFFSILVILAKHFFLLT
jgi:hypothetical protein